MVFSLERQLEVDDVALFQVYRIFQRAEFQGLLFGCRILRRMTAPSALLRWTYARIACNRPASLTTAEAVEAREPYEIVTKYHSRPSRLKTPSACQRHAGNGCDADSEWPGIIYEIERRTRGANRHLSGALDF
jgi:hypothetical protein